MLKEYINGRVISLVERIKSCEDERKSILSEVTTLKNSAGNSGTWGSLKIMCENLEMMLNNLSVNVQKESETNREPQFINRPPRKCRYFNRGFCKYREGCKYYHSPVICKDYVEVGICRKSSCFNRHPKTCKHWSVSPNGCPREDSCLYLHKRSGQYVNDNIDDASEITSENSENEVSDCDERLIVRDNEASFRTHVDTCQIRENAYQCDVCNYKCDNKDDHKCHREELSEEMLKYYENIEVDPDYQPEDIETIVRRYEN